MVILLFALAVRSSTKRRREMARSMKEQSESDLIPFVYFWIIEMLQRYSVLFWCFIDVGVRYHDWERQNMAQIRLSCSVSRDTAREWRQQSNGMFWIPTFHTVNWYLSSNLRFLLLLSVSLMTDHKTDLNSWEKVSIDIVTVRSHYCYYHLPYHIRCNLLVVPDLVAVVTVMLCLCFRSHYRRWLGDGPFTWSAGWGAGLMDPNSGKGG